VILREGGLTERAQRHAQRRAGPVIAIGIAVIAALCASLDEPIPAARALALKSACAIVCVLLAAVASLTYVSIWLLLGRTGVRTPKPSLLLGERSFAHLDEVLNRERHIAHTWVVVSARARPIAVVAVPDEGEDADQRFTG